MINSKQLREYVIEPVLHGLGAGGDSAVALVLMTAAVESGGGRYLHQLEHGPACGICQMEPATHDDIWANFLRYRAGAGFTTVRDYLADLGQADPDTLAARVRAWQIPGVYDNANAREMCGNLYYAVAMCRVHYLRVPARLPAANDIPALAAYHKRYYNTALGASDVAKSVAAYHRFVA